MTSPHLGRRVICCALCSRCPAIAHAQEAALTGTVTDSTGAVLPGVTVTAVHEATGNTFVAVTDDRGVYRLAGRVGVYRITAELAGFTAVTRENLQLLVGQTRPSTCRCWPSTVQETVTVTAEAPLLNVIDVEPGRQHRSDSRCRSCRSHGRNWMALALLAPGSRTSSTNATAPLPDRNGGEAREFQLNLDGSRCRRSSAPAISRVQPGLDRGVPVHLEPVRRDAGPIDRRAGERDHQVGHQPALGPVPDQLPRQQVQRGGSGPAPRSCRSATSSTARRSAARSSRDRLHYFGNFEYEREPRTSIWNTPYPAFNIELTGNERPGSSGGVRLDYQLSPQTRLMGKVSRHKTLRAVRPWRVEQPSGADGHQRRAQRRIHRPVHAGAEQPGAERSQGRLQPLRVQERAAHRLVEALAGAVASPTATRASRSPASPSPATPTIRGTATRRSRSCATTSRSRTTRAAATT